jgi:hypothetical protein
MTAVDARSAIVDTVRDYFEAWYDGDAARMARALHPGLAQDGWRIVNALWEPAR